MFGSSQDRARQLAARKRKERICSHDSHSSYRSISSSSQASQQSHTIFPLEQDIKRPLAIPEHPSHGASLTYQSQHTPGDPYVKEALNDNQVPVLMAHDTSQCADGRTQSQLEQYRLQAEYLGKVLYGSLNIPALDVPPQSQFGSSSHYSPYGSLGMQSNTSYHLRSVTDPLSPTLLPTQHLSILHRQSSIPTTSTPWKTALDDDHQMQVALSLRGGGNGETSSRPDHINETKEAKEAKEANETNGANETDKPNPMPGHLQNHSSGVPPSHLQSQHSIETRAFAREFPWVTKVFHLPQWHAPIFSGAALDAFLISLSSVQLSQFCSFFDPHLPPKPMANHLVPRQLFFRALSSRQQNLFKNIINVRLIWLLAQSGTPPDTKQQERFEMPKDERIIYTTLPYLLEATEDPSISMMNPNLPNQYYYASLPPLRYPAVSARHMEQQQTVFPFPGHSLYCVPSMLCLIVHN